jgi:hypothetical protein
VASSRLIPCALAAALALSACTTGGDGDSSTAPGDSVARGMAGPSGPSPLSGPSGSVVEIPTPTPSSLTPEDYRAQIADVRDPVRAAFTKLAASGKLTTLEKRAGDTAEALQSAADRLDALAPPAEAQTLHTEYARALRDLSTRLGTAAVDVGSRSVCTASGLLTRLGTSPEVAAVNEAGEALRRLGDYPVVTVKAPKRQTRRLSTGSYIRSESRTGRGTLTIHNGGTHDAVVTLVRGKSKVISVYVRKKGKFTVSGVRDGKYRIYFTTGADWDRKAKSFTRSCSFSQFDDPLGFKTTYTSTHVRWQTWRITLHRITGGNARTRNVDPDKFPV